MATAATHYYPVASATPNTTAKIPKYSL
jgi:hypothetical protein